MIKIREEREEDHYAVREINDNAFGLLVRSNAVMLKTKLTNSIYLLIILMVVCHNSFAQVISPSQSDR